MGKFRVLIKPSAVREIENIPQQADRRRIVKRISALADEPRPADSQKLSGQDRYRLRQGRFRTIYSIQEGESPLISVVKVWYRKGL